MKYVSAKEKAEEWGISPRRVSTLASEGRIPDAAIIGKSWMIPATAEKPTDSRFKKNQKAKSNYHFPIPLRYLNAEEQKKNLMSKDEVKLQEAVLIYESGDFKKARKCLNRFEEQQKIATQKSVHCTFFFSSTPSPTSLKTLSVL